MSGKTSTESKAKYNKTAYARYSVYVRKDSELYEKIEIFMSKKGSSLNYVILKQLREFFNVMEG